jgi:LysR family nitrogen assimilation transcriptional regulator
MDLKKLRAFAVVADFKSFSKAAVHLSVSQGLLSKHIGELETELGVRLFYRNGRGALLTAEGERLLSYARRLDGLVEETVAAIKGLRATPSGTVILGISSAVGATLTVPLLQCTRARYPLISLNVVDALSGTVHEWLNTGRIDIAVVFDAVRNSALLHEDLFEEHLLLVSPIGHALPDEVEVEGQALRELPLLVPSRSHKLRVLIDDYCRALGFRPDPVAELDALLPLIQAVKAGLGHTILPLGAAEHEASVGRVRLSRIVGPSLRRTVFMATSAERIPTIASRTMAQLIREQCRELEALGRWHPDDATLRALRQVHSPHQ